MSNSDKVLNGLVAAYLDKVSPGLAKKFKVFGYYFMFIIA